MDEFLKYFTKEEWGRLKKEEPNVINSLLAKKFKDNLSKAYEVFVLLGKEKIYPIYPLHEVARNKKPLEKCFLEGRFLFLVEKEIEKENKENRRTALFQVVTGSYPINLTPREWLKEVKVNMGNQLAMVCPLRYNFLHINEPQIPFSKFRPGSFNLEKLILLTQRLEKNKPREKLRDLHRIIEKCKNWQQLKMEETIN
jgi:hypothetical protein